MICPNCGNKMKCYDTANNKQVMKTARKYLCQSCEKKIITLEVVTDSNEARYILAEKWRKA